MKLIFKVIFFIAGLFILTFGIVLTIRADLGIGAYDALNVALSERFGFTIGTWVIITGFIIIFINAILMKRRPMFLSAITMFVIGLFVDFWSELVFKDWAPTSLVIAITIFIVGLALIAAGIGLYLQPQFPPGPIDQLMVALRFRFDFSIVVAKTIAEVSSLILALLLGGPIGIGTLVITFAIGWFVQVIYPYMEKLYLLSQS